MKKLKSSQYTNLTKNKHEETGSNHNCPVYSSGGRDISQEGWDTAQCMFHGQQNTAAKCSGHEQSVCWMRGSASQA